MILNERLTYSAICNLRIACYEIVDDSKWMAKLFSDPKPHNVLLLHCSLFQVNVDLFSDIIVVSKGIVDLLGDM